MVVRAVGLVRGAGFARSAGGAHHPARTGNVQPGPHRVWIALIAPGRSPSGVRA